MLADDDQSLADHLSARVISIEYAGYSVLRDMAATQKNVLASCRAVIRHLSQTGSVQFDQKTFVFGFSLGTGMAADIVHGLNQRGLGLNMGSMLLASPFSSLRNVAYSTFPKRFVDGLVADLLNTEALITKILTKAVIIGANEDPVIPFSHAQELAYLRNDAGLITVFQGIKSNDHYAPMRKGVFILGKMIDGKKVESMQALEDFETTGYNNYGDDCLESAKEIIERLNKNKSQIEEAIRNAEPIVLPGFEFLGTLLQLKDKKYPQGKQRNELLENAWLSAVKNFWRLVEIAPDSDVAVEIAADDLCRELWQIGFECPDRSVPEEAIRNEYLKIVH